MTKPGHPLTAGEKRKSDADFYRHMSRVHVTAHVIAGIKRERSSESQSHFV